MDFAKIIPTRTEANRLYFKLREKSPKWFQACPKIDANDYDLFIPWVMDFTMIYETGGLILFTKRLEHVVEIHAAFLEHIDLGLLLRIKRDLASEGVVRIEVPLIDPKGHQIQKCLRAMNFSLEGVLRKKVKYYNVESQASQIANVEMWALILEEEQ